MTPEDQRHVVVAACTDLQDIQSRVFQVNDALNRLASSLLHPTILPKDPQAQEPRLTLGRVPAGGEGQYVIYFPPEIELPSMRCFWNPEKGWKLDIFPQDANRVIASFGPIPYTASEVTAAWNAAGRPT